MPLDGNPPPPTLRTLSTILRDRRTWPRDFVWDFRECRTCAMGLAEKLFKEVTAPDTVEMSRVFDIPWQVTDDLFIYLHEEKDTKLVTPEDVADAIDAYLATASEKVLVNAM